MFGEKKIKLSKELFEQVERVAKLAGYSSVDEFVIHSLEKDEEIKEKLKGLGYLA